MAQTFLQTQEHDKNRQVPDWRSLKLLNFYRLFLATLFLLLFILGVTGNILGSSMPKLFFWANLLYLSISITFIYSAYTQSPGFKSQVTIQLATDILAITLLMHSSGGIESGLGMLLVVHVTASGVFLSKRLAYLTASIASLSVLAEQVGSNYLLHYANINYPKAGLLGLLLFSAAIFAARLTERSRQSEEIAREKTANLADLEKLNEHIIRYMRTGIAVVLPDGQIYMANEAAEALLGNRKLEGMPHLSSVSPALFTRLKQWQENPELQQLPLKQEQGLPDLQPGMSKLDEKRDNSEIIIFLEDAAQLNQRFQEVKLASLGRLTASIAHEIRNPLGAIKHAAQLLNESLVDPSNIKLSQIINTQVQRLNHIIENILQLSRQNPSSLEPINLKEWLENFKDEFCLTQGLSPDQVNVDISPHDTQIVFDRNHLHQVFWNLCSNAITHNPEPKEKVHIKLQGGTSIESRQPFVDVIDNGAGIEPELIHLIFDPFFTTNTNGTGLGLYITREMIENNRAKIRYLPLPHGGSCFKIHFLSPRNQNNAQIS